MINGFYMDESGNTGFGDIPQQPVLCYGGILVPNNNITKLEQEFQTISYGIKLAIQQEIKGVSGKDFDEMPFFVNYEMHGKPFVDGDRLYSKIPAAGRIAYVEEILKLLQGNDVKVIAAIINKAPYKAATGETHHMKMHGLAFTELVRLIEEELSGRKQSGVIICDNGRPGECDLLLRTIRQESNTGLIFNDLTIKDSHSSQLVQLADIVVFVSTIFFRNQYGFARKHFNAQLVGLYRTYLAHSSKVWEYEVPKTP